MRQLHPFFLLKEIKSIGPRAGAAIGNYFSSLIHSVATLYYVRFVFLFFSNPFCQLVIYLLLGLTVNLIFFSTITFCDDSPSASQVPAATQDQPSNNYILLDNYLRFPSQSPSWVTCVRNCLAEARPEDFESTVLHFLKLESCGYATRSIEHHFSNLYCANSAPLAPQILQAGVKEMLIRYQINDIESLNQVLSSLTYEREQSPFFRLTLSESEIINSARRTQLREAAEAAQREAALRDLVFEKEAIESRLGILIKKNHEIFGDIVAAEMRGGQQPT